MAQHDYSIANAGGAAVRSDINDVLAAILSQNSGATEPAVTAPFMPWYDTAAGALKIRNAANTAWVLFADFALPNDSVTAAKIAANAVGTSELANDAVTLDKLQNIATAQLLGRNTTGSGDVEQLAPATVRALLGLAAIATSGSGADITTGNIAAARITTALNASGSAPIYASRAWVNFDGTGTVAIRASGNVSSITDNGVGDHTVNFASTMPDANYSVLVTGKVTDSTVREQQVFLPFSLATTSCRLHTNNASGVATDNALSFVNIVR